jgi:hypothetical protein
MWKISAGRADFPRNASGSEEEDEEEDGADGIAPGSSTAPANRMLRHTFGPELSHDRHKPGEDG